MAAVSASAGAAALWGGRPRKPLIGAGPCPCGRCTQTGRASAGRDRAGQPGPLVVVLDGKKERSVRGAEGPGRAGGEDGRAGHGAVRAEHAATDLPARRALIHRKVEPVVSRLYGDAPARPGALPLTVRSPTSTPASRYAPSPPAGQAFPDQLSKVLQEGCRRPLQGFCHGGGAGADDSRERPELGADEEVLEEPSARKEARVRARILASP